MALLLSSGIRMLFPPPGGQLSGANAPASWLKLSSGEGGTPQITITTIMNAALALAVLLVVYEVFK